MKPSRPTAAWLLALLLTCSAQAADTHTVAGTVVNRVTGKPLNKVRVYLTGASVAPVLTGENGRFRFDGVKPGKYPLSAERLGFEPQSYRQRSLATPYSTGIVAGEGQSTGNLTFALIPGAVIAGTVKDTHGEPIAGLDVGALRVVGLGSARRTIRAGSTSTDDRGQYRVHSLPAGNYLLVFSRGSRGEPVSTTPMTYPLTYFPGTTAAAEAGTFRLEAGKETRGDVAIEAVPVVSITATVPQGPERYRVTVVSSGPFGTEFEVGSPQMASANAFNLTALPAGRYTAQLWNAQDQVIGRKDFDATSAGVEIALGETPYPRLQAQVELRGTPRHPGTPIMLQLNHENGFSRGSTSLDAEGRATVDALPPGEYEILVAQGELLPLISVAVSGGSLVQGRLVVPGTESVGLKIVADASGAQNVAGLVEREEKLQRGGQPEGGLLVMLAPAVNWENTASYRFDQSDSDGTFTWLAVPAGDYLAFAFADGEPEDYANATVLRSLTEKGQGQKVTVTQDPKQVVRLTAR